MNFFFKTYWKSLAVIVVIFFLSVFNFSSVEKEMPHFKYSDKLVHICMYAALSFILMYDYKKDVFIKSKIPFLYFILAVFPFAYGGIIEIIQQEFFPPRSAEFLDWVADAIGAVAGGITGMVVLKSS